MRLSDYTYATDATTEHFLSFDTEEGRLAGFLRLSLPGAQQAHPEPGEVWRVMPEISGAAMIRELHVYGPALGIGRSSDGEAQHLGLGRRLVDASRAAAGRAGYRRLAVISAIGTRRYYERLGFARDGHYMIETL
jgi:elongator complex protein 3